MDNLKLIITGKEKLADDIFLFELRDQNNAALPVFEAGAHVVIHTPAGLLRCYSLCNAPSERDRYLLGIKREDSGGGGSKAMVDKVGLGDTLTISPPENYFSLSTDAKTHVLIAGGIGITPILAMARQLHAAGAPFRVIYCARSQSMAAFADELCDSAFSDHVMIHYDGGDIANVLNFREVLADRPDGAHVYCCGPWPLMHAVKEAARHWPHDAVHFEDFGTNAQPDAAGEKTFAIKLARSGASLTVPPGISILEILRRHGIDVPSSCEAGTCGSCRMGLLSGKADHRDYVLDDDEQESEIMICVSRAISDELTLDV
jgi:phthalate 4,5-dioxygenase reductase subunit